MSQLNIERIVERGIAKRRTAAQALIVRQVAETAVADCLLPQDCAHMRTAFLRAMLDAIVARIVTQEGEIHTASLLSAISRRIVTDDQLKLIAQSRAEALFSREEAA